MSTEKFNDFKELFIHELKDIYSAESMLVDALPEVANACTTERLQKAIEEHHSETVEQKRRLDEIADILNVDLSGETCDAMKGLITECEDMIKSESDGTIKDAGIIACAQRVEHYEIAAYGTVCAFAKDLGFDDVADLLETTLSEEKEADTKLNDIAINHVNARAMQ
jgi:ferritin-like metal-binding protein YciE